MREDAEPSLENELWGEDGPHHEVAPFRRNERGRHKRADPKREAHCAECDATFPSDLPLPL